MNKNKVFKTKHIPQKEIKREIQYDSGVDVVFLSYAKSKMHWNYTQNAIYTLLKSEENIKFNIIVIESELTAVPFEKAKTVYVKSENFNYNAYMNLGVSFGNSRYVAMCNNDLEFKKDWCSILLREMRNHNVLSGSPMSDQAPLQIPYRKSTHVRFGYNGSDHISGWCIMADRKLFELIGKLDETPRFWCSETYYAIQLKEKNIKHIFVPYSKVYHCCSKTLNTMPKDKYVEMTKGEVKRYGGDIAYTKAKQLLLA